MDLGHTYADEYTTVNFADRDTHQMLESGRGEDSSSTSGKSAPTTGRKSVDRFPSVDDILDRLSRYTDSASYGVRSRA